MGEEARCPSRLTRREAISLVGASAGIALAAACQGATPSSSGREVSVPSPRPGDLAYLPAVDQAELVRRREVSPVELVSACLERIERFNPQLLAFVTIATEQALNEARRMEQDLTAAGEEPPPFLGVPISIKDITPTAGIRTTYSSKVFAEWIPAEDHPVVARLRRAGFVVVGKTNTPEFATSFTESDLNGVCRNPWDRSRTPGGSSGGAAAAVAAGLGAVAHGNDFGGSIRVPASFCGIVGLKPSRGRVAFGPTFRDVWGDSHSEGPLTRTVADCAALMDVMVGHLRQEWHWAPAPERPFLMEVGRPSARLRVAVSTEAPMGVTQSECATAANAAARLIESLGHDVEDATPDWASILETADAMSGAGVGAIVDESDVDRLEPRNQATWRAAQDVRNVDVLRAQPRLEAARRTFLSFWDTYDLLVTPTCGIEPPPVESYVRWDMSPEEHGATFATFPNFAQPFNLSGQPAMSLPLHWTSQGIPIGVQLVGRVFDEATLIRLAAEVEQAAPWRDRIPAFEA